MSQVCRFQFCQVSDLMEASGVLETNKCLGLTRKGGGILFLSHCLLLARFYKYL